MNASSDLVIQHATLVCADVEEVYDALTTAQGLDSWFTNGSSVEAFPGGEIHFRWVDWGPDRVSAQDRGPVVEAVCPSRFVFQWHPEDETYTTTVEIDLESVPEGAIVRLRETGYPDTPSARKAFVDCATGWGEALTLLKFFVEYGIKY